MTPNLNFYPKYTTTGLTRDFERHVLICICSWVAADTTDRNTTTIREKGHSETV